MNVEYSKPFLKAVDKLSGKVLSSVLDMIREVKNANGIDEITNCKKLIAYKSVYRIRIGDYSAYSGGYPFSISGDIRSVPS